MDIKPKQVTKTSGAVQVTKTQVVQPEVSNPESPESIQKDLAAFDKMRRIKCPKCNIWDPEQDFCTMGITIGDAPMGKCPEYKSIPKTKPEQVFKQESAVPKTEISGLLKMARSRVLHHVPKCPPCGYNNYTMEWDGRKISLKCEFCGNILIWDPSPSWTQIMIVEKWLSGL